MSDQTKMRDGIIQRGSTWSLRHPRARTRRRELIAVADELLGEETR